jgi:probable HAF family extracellular repeat protein
MMINERGDVVGFAGVPNDPDGNLTPAFRWSKKDGWHWIPFLPGDIASTASSINNGGVIVGYSNDANGNNHPWVLVKGAPINLNDLIEPGSGLTAPILLARDVNEARFRERPRRARRLLRGRCGEGMRTRVARALLMWTSLVLLAHTARSGGDHPCADPAYRQFDFWIGDWDVFEVERPAVIMARALRGHVATLRGTYCAIWNQCLEAGEWAAACAPILERHHPTFDPTTGHGGVEIWVPLS